MPINVVKSKADEKKWNRAKAEAEKGGYKGDSKWKVTMKIFKNMKKHGFYKPASRAEVDFFVKQAMAEYVKRGIPFEKAATLFSRRMGELAVELGLARPEDKALKLASAAVSEIARSANVPKAQAATMFAHELVKKSTQRKVAAIKKEITGVLRRQSGYDKRAPGIKAENLRGYDKARMSFKAGRGNIRQKQGVNA